MKIQKSLKPLIAAVGIVSAAILCAAAFHFYTPTFQGSRVKNPDAYLLDIQRMNGTDSHILELKKDATLQIQFETLKGSLRMEIKGENENLIYSGNGKETTDFQLKIPEDGCYTILIEAKQAKGTVHIILKTEGSCGTQPLQKTAVRT